MMDAANAARGPGAFSELAERLGGMRVMVRNSQPVALSRREMLRAVSVATMGLVGGLLAACSSPAPPAPAATAAPAAPAAAQPTAAAAGTSPTQAAARQPVAPAAPAAPAAPKPGRQLIGQIERPSVRGRAAQMPQTFRRSPLVPEPGKP